MKVSIITICYNSAATIEQTIGSVERQTYSDIEYIVVDGGSTDDTLKIVTAHRTFISKIVSEKDNGLYDALNKGISLATGDIIGFLHSDDLFANQHVIEKYVRCFELTKADAVYADLDYVQRSDTDKITRKWRSGDYRHGIFKFGWMPPHPTFFVRKKVYEEFGKFNTALRSAADYEIMLRFIHRHRIQLSYLPEVTVKMRMGGTSNASIGNRVKANREDRFAWKLNGLKPPFYTLYLKPLRKIFQFF